MNETSQALVWKKRGNPVKHFACGERVKVCKKMFRNWYLVCVRLDADSETYTIVGQIDKLADAKSFAERYCHQHNIT